MVYDNAGNANEAWNGRGGRVQHPGTSYANQYWPPYSNVNPHSFLTDLQNRFGGYLPPFDTGRGPAFGAGYGTWSGQTGQAFGPGTIAWNPGTELTDQQIENLLYDALDDDPMVPDTADIGVSVKDHVVTLSGTVRNKNLKRHLDAMAWAAPGVRDVNNTIQVKGRRPQGSTSGQTQKETRPAPKTETRAKAGTGAR